MNNYEKYLKYKNKYLKLKNTKFIGGAQSSKSDDVPGFAPHIKKGEATSTFDPNMNNAKDTRGFGLPDIKNKNLHEASIGMALMDAAKDATPDATKDATTDATNDATVFVNTKKTNLDNSTSRQNKIGPSPNIFNKFTNLLSTAQSKENKSKESTNQSSKSDQELERERKQSERKSIINIDPNFNNKDGKNYVQNNQSWKIPESLRQRFIENQSKYGKRQEQLERKQREQREHQEQLKLSSGYLNDFNNLKNNSNPYIKEVDQFLKELSTTIKDNATILNERTDMLNELDDIIQHIKKYKKSEYIKNLNLLLNKLLLYKTHVNDYKIK